MGSHEERRCLSWDRPTVVDHSFVYEYYPGIYRIGIHSADPFEHAIETKVESGTSQSKSATSVDSSNSVDFLVLELLVFAQEFVVLECIVFT